MAAVGSDSVGVALAVGKNLKLNFGAWEGVDSALLLWKTAGCCG